MQEKWKSVDIESAPGEKLRVSWCSPRPPLFACIFVHGVNRASPSFFPLVSSLSTMQFPFLYVVYDLGGHGHSSGTRDLSMVRLVSDLETVVKCIKSTFPQLDERIMFCGHSLGAVIACRYLAKHRESFSHLGLVMLDFVEGSALPTISSHVSQLRSMPLAFPTLEAAVDWCLTSGTSESAKIAKCNLEHTLTPDLRWVAEGFMARVNEAVLQEWFKGTSAAFVSLSLPRLLIVASVESLLDRELTVQQMQGKFKVVVQGGKGFHSFHEESAPEVAREISAFVERVLSNKEPVKFISNV